MKRISSGIEYELTYKSVKNINLRVRRDGSVHVSLARRVGAAAADALVASKAAWIEDARARALSRPKMDAQMSTGECLALFESVLDDVLPLFREHIAGRPAIRVRAMTSRWGVCHYMKKTIVLSSHLAGMPRPFIEYVVAHECAHFLHHDHQAGFHALMAAVMPDYRQRRKLSRGSRL